MQRDKGGGVAHGKVHHLINTNPRSKLFRQDSLKHPSPHLPVECVGQMSQSDEVESDRITCGGTLHSHTHLQSTAFDGSL